MTPLPLIVGFGGISPAGRSSCHQGYRRLVETALPEPARQSMLASLRGLSANQTEADLLAGTLIRGLESTLFDPSALPARRLISPEASTAPVSFRLSKKQLPKTLPATWRIVSEHADSLEISCLGQDFWLDTTRPSAVNSAGQLPCGFDPARLYASHNHPRGLQMTVFGASDAINSLGINWERLRECVPPDAFSVYAGSCMGQLDQAGFGGMLQARLQGRKVSSKQLPLGFNEMPADFINAYLLGSLGTTGTSVAACATFLYNLRQGVQDIASGQARVALVGTSEAPLTPEIIEGYCAMGALADDAKLRALDKLAQGEAVDARRACRPFGDNCGFTLAESAQFVVLMDDSLALELGAEIHGSVSDVFINADGYKKSIASPGLGNYLTLAKAAAATRAIVGEKSLRRRSLVQAHGTGTPQNRVSESELMSRVATEFGIEGWRISAVKAFVGHSLASSAGDQLMATLGLWQQGLIPGISTIDRLADDVHRDKLDFVLSHREVARDSIDTVLLNSKGFGGNNATAVVLAPHTTSKMLTARHGAAAMKRHAQENEFVAAEVAAYDAQASSGQHRVHYSFGEGVLDGSALDFRTKDSLGPSELRIGTSRAPLSLNPTSPYAGLLDSVQD